MAINKNRVASSNEDEEVTKSSIIAIYFSKAEERKEHFSCLNWNINGSKS